MATTEDRLFRVPVVSLEYGDIVQDIHGEFKEVYEVTIIPDSFAVRLNLEGVLYKLTTDTLVQFNLTKTYKNWVFRNARSAIGV